MSSLIRKLTFTGVPIAVAMIVLLCSPLPVAAQSNPAYAPPQVDPSLPNVLLLGDSISIGYMLATRRELAGQANTWRPAANCGPTSNGLESLDRWLGNQRWDVIHFNFGLHDLKFMGPNGENLYDQDLPGAHRQIPLDAYSANLQRIVRRLQATGAKLIWCETTPVPEGIKSRIAQDVVRYNEAAAKVINEAGGIAINPLYEFALEHAEQRPANVHYTPAGSETLAKQVANAVRLALDSDAVRQGGH
jgi:acyl-CoA thioesterase-1